MAPAIWRAVAGNHRMVMRLERRPDRDRPIRRSRFSGTPSCAPRPGWRRRRRRRGCVRWQTHAPRRIGRFRARTPDAFSDAFELIDRGGRAPIVPVGEMALQRPPHFGRIGKFFRRDAVEADAGGEFPHMHGGGDRQRPRPCRSPSPPAFRSALSSAGQRRGDPGCVASAKSRPLIR